MGAEQSSQQPGDMARSAPMSSAQSPSKNASGSSTMNPWASHSSQQNNLDVPRQRQRSKSESGGGRHFADFSLFPDRYDSGGAMNRSSTMNEGFSGRQQLSRLSSMPEEPPKRPQMDSNFHRKQQDFPYMDYSLIPEKDPKMAGSSGMWGNRVRMSSTGDDIPRDAARHDGQTTIHGTKHFFDFSMFPDKMDSSSRRN